MKYCSRFKTILNLGFCRWNNSVTTGHVRVCLREKDEKLIQSGFTMSLSQELNTQRICLNCGELFPLHNVLDPHCEMGLLQQ